MNNITENLSVMAQTADACERSWSLGAHETEERVLFFCETSVKAAEQIARAAQSLGITDSLLADWSTAIPGADAIGLALRCDRQSVRLYTQYWTMIGAHVKRGNRSPFPLYRGFKSLPGGVVRSDDYLAIPMAPPEVFWPRMAEGFAAFDLDTEQAQDVFRDLDAGNAIFTVTSGEGRKSWLTTVRRADIDRAEVADWLAPLAARPLGDDIITAARTTDLVHVAGGQDAVKGDFLTFYFESDPESVLARLR